MYKLSAVCIAIFFSGCINMPSYSGSSKISSINGEGKSNSIKADLTRATQSGGFVQMIGYYATVTPYTKAYLTSLHLEQCEKNLKSTEICKIELKSVLDVSKNKSCFYLDLTTMDIQWAKASSWLIKIEQPSSVYIDAEISSFSIIPRITGTIGRVWGNSGEACTKTPIDFEKEFKMHIIPQFGGKDFKELILIWEEPKKTNKQ